MPPQNGKGRRTHAPAQSLSSNRLADDHAKNTVIPLCGRNEWPDIDRHELVVTIRRACEAIYFADGLASTEVATALWYLEGALVEVGLPRLSCPPGPLKAMAGTLHAEASCLFGSSFRSAFACVWAAARHVAFEAGWIGGCEEVAA